MYEIRIPDHIYKQATLAAQTHHVSLEEFVIEALQIHAQNDHPSVKLSPEQIAIIRQGQAEIKTGKFLTSEQIKSDLAANRAAWQNKGPH
ncbi:MAG TPA: hypothetical protein VGL56_06275 [Fimbriimonadaceae bacterium]|jgi:predicted transcriptional regulator